MNIDLCKRCLKAKDAKIIDSSYHKGSGRYRIVLQYSDDDELSFNIHVWTKAQDKDMTNNDIVSKTDIISCDCGNINFSCPFWMEHQVSDLSRNEL